MKFSTVAVFVSAAVWSVLLAEDKTYKDVIETAKKCVEDDKSEMVRCMRQYINDLLPFGETSQGIPELNVPSLKPLTVKSYNLPQKTSLVEGDFHISDLEISGLADLNVTDIVLNPDQGRFVLNASLPLLYLEGHYVVDGTVMVMRIKGNDTFWLKLNDVQVTANGLVTKKGEHLQLVERFYDGSIKNGSIHLNSLLGGSEVGEAVNNILNDNFMLFYEDLKPFVMGIIQKIGDYIVAGPIESLPASMLDA